MRLISGIFVGVSMALAAPALAQSGGAATVGMQVVDTTGGAVGTVKAIKGDNLLVQTDKHEALLPKVSFAVSEGKLYFSMTQAQLDAEIEKHVAAAQASVAAGATVKGLSGTAIGKIDSLTDDSVVIALSSGKKVEVNKTGVRGNADGTVTVGLTSEQLEAQVQGGSTSSK
jgi:preprotein translocase subunit YajC